MEECQLLNYSLKCVHYTFPKQRIATLGKEESSRPFGTEIMQITCGVSLDAFHPRVKMLNTADWEVGRGAVSVLLKLFAVPLQDGRSAEIDTAGFERLKTEIS